MPFPNVRVLGPNLRFFRDQGIRGYSSEAHSRTPGTELAELRTWLADRLAWNPDFDEQQLIRTFCNGYYGAAAGPHIVAYIDALHDGVAETDVAARRLGLRREIPELALCEDCLAAPQSS